MPTNEIRKALTSFETSKTGRREFTVASALAVLSGVLITVTDCGGAGGAYGGGPTTPSPSPTPTPSSGDVVGQISANHGHRAVITNAQLMAGNALMLDIQGTAQHTHAVALTAAEVESIDSGDQIAKQSTVSSGPVYSDHSHTVTFN